MSNNDDLKSGAAGAGNGSPAVPEPLGERIERRWRKAYTVRSEEDLRAFYDDWARTYDEDHDAVGCFHHVTAARVLARHLPDEEAAILDVGAGTGLAGIELRKLGYSNLAAVDFSDEMLQVAREQHLYRRYWVLNLSTPFPQITDSSFDAAVGVGIFSYGQVERACLDELLRIVRPGGFIGFTQRVDFHESNEMGLRDRQRALEEAGRWELVEVTEPAPYLPNKEPDALFRMWLYRAKT